MGWIRCFRCEKFRRKFVAQTFALVRPRFAPRFVRHPNGLECTQIVRNEPKHQIRVQGVDRVRLFRKIPTRLRGTNFSTSSARLASSFVRQPNGPDCNQIVRKAPKCLFRVQWVDRVCLLRKIPTRLHGTNFSPSFVRQPK